MKHDLYSCPFSVLSENGKKNRLATVFNGTPPTPEELKYLLQRELKKKRLDFSQKVGWPRITKEILLSYRKITRN
jgi:hypothetical protein